MSFTYFSVPSLQNSLDQLKRSSRAIAKFCIKKKFYRNKYVIKTISFYPILYAVPNECSGIIVCLISGKRCNEKIKSLYVNGIPVRFNIIQQGLSKQMYLVDPKNFEPWENIVSFPISEMEQIRTIAFSVILYPILKSGSPENGILVGKKVLIEKKILGKRSSEKLFWFPNKPNCGAGAKNFILRAQNSIESSRFFGTFFSCYDYDAASYRLGSWIWCSAPVIRALLNTGEIQDRLIAIKTATNLLNRQINEGENKGGFCVRWDSTLDAPRGTVPWLAPNDSAMIAAYGLLPAYDATGDEKFLKSAIFVGEWILENALKEDGTLLVGYREDLSGWVDNWLYVDAGFTGLLFKLLFEQTGDSIWENALRKFSDRYIEMFYSHRGYFYKAWFNNGTVDKNIFARGQAWALEGLIAAEQCFPGRYAKILDCVSRYLLETQDHEGAWSYLINKRFSGQCNKGTPVIAYHLYRIAEILRKPELSLAADNAMLWCVRNVYQRAEACMGQGGICAKNKEGSIITAENINNSFTYGNAWFLLAKVRYWENRQNW